LDFSGEADGDATRNLVHLVWACEPSSPLGQAHADWPRWLMQPGRELHQTLVLDCAYAPLRLSGHPSLTAAQHDQVWQLFSPNKSLGLTGVRAAYALAPQGSEMAVLELERLCASWPVGAHGVAMLQVWVQPDVQSWLTQSLQTLADWKSRQIHELQRLAWTCLPSNANFFCARPPGDDLAAELQRLRTHDIKLRNAASFGLPGHVRLGVLPPQAQDALFSALCVSN
jgi:histidinol-phosphate aminotransferase